MPRRLLILSGPTHEYFDAVRFIGNASSGKMGRAIAEEATKRGWKVDFVTGPVSDALLPRGANISLHRVVSAQDMLEAARPLFSKAEATIFAAAVADYTPAEKERGKRPKTPEGFMLRLLPTPDIAQTLCAKKRAEQVAIGFALQTENGEEYARRKLQKKNLDGILLNTPATLGQEKGTFHYLSRQKEQFETWGEITKTACAKKLLDLLE